MGQKYTKKYLSGLDSKEESETIIKSSFVLGEIGRLNDLSGVKDIAANVDNLFNHSDPDVKQAASHCMGHICIGNLTHFLPIVIDNIKSGNASHKYLLLIAIREIIDTKQQVIEENYETLSEILFENASSKEEKIRNVVSECLGMLFASCGLEMITQFDDKLTSTNVIVRSTIAKSFKYAASKHVDPTSMAQVIPEIIELATDCEHLIRQFTLESLISIAHHLPDLLKKDIDTLLKVIASQVLVKPELVKEVDLGPFKHKIDEGRPIRKAGFVLLDTLYEKMPERINIPMVLDIMIIGLADKDEDCVSQTLHILNKLIKWAPGAVVGQMTTILDKMPSILKAPPKGSTKISLRIATNTLGKISQISEMETNTDFQKFITDHNLQFDE